MTHPDQRTRRGKTTKHDRRARPGHASTRQARIRRSFDGVVASYIRDISMEPERRASA
jgi:hypothetical protein